MKKILFSLFALGLANFCQAQTTNKKEKVKTIPHAIKKNKATKKTTNTVKFKPPVIIKDEEIRSPKPEIKKTKTSKENEDVDFTPPVIVKDSMK